MNLSEGEGKKDYYLWNITGMTGEGAGLKKLENWVTSFVDNHLLHKVINP